MATRKPPPIPEAKKLSAEETVRAISKIAKRVEELQQFDISAITGRADAPVEALRHKINSTLADILGEGTTEYRRYQISDLSALPLIMGRQWHVLDHQRGTREGFDRAISKLQGLVEILQERLDDLETSATTSMAGKQPQVRKPGRRVFVVHGHDEVARLEVERFLKKLNFEPIILHDQANAGRTIIEKLEHFTDVDFAVILLTPDDEGRALTAGAETALRTRARQNVVLELGLFYGLLGRGKVCALHKGSLELPSDFQGVLYTPLDSNGGWHLALARELRAAGLDVDMNLAF